MVREKFGNNCSREQSIHDTLPSGTSQHRTWHKAGTSIARVSEPWTCQASSAATDTNVCTQVLKPAHKSKNALLMQLRVSTHRLRKNKELKEPTENKNK
eukprot:4489765-Amphidinium_carterae.1